MQIRKGNRQASSPPDRSSASHASGLELEVPRSRWSLTAEIFRGEGSCLAFPTCFLSPERSKTEAAQAPIMPNLLTCGRLLPKSYHAATNLQKCASTTECRWRRQPHPLPIQAPGHTALKLNLLASVSTRIVLPCPGISRAKVTKESELLLSQARIPRFERFGNLLAGLTLVRPG